MNDPVYSSSDPLDDVAEWDDVRAVIDFLQSGSHGVSVLIVDLDGDEMTFLFHFSVEEFLVL